MESLKKYTVSLIDPSVLVSKGIKTLFDEQSSFEIIQSVSDLTPFFERPTARKPDIILINPMVIDFQRQHQIRSIFSDYNQSILIAIIYNFIDQDLLKQYHGSITLFDDSIKIYRKIRQAIESNRELSDMNDTFDLSDREKEILISVVKGMQNKEIAEYHNISIHTVISHRKNISRKTGIKSVAGLTVYALLNQLLDKDEIE